MLVSKESFYGTVTIEIPQNVNRFFQVDDSEFSENFCRNLEEFEKENKGRKFPRYFRLPPRLE